MTATMTDQVATLSPGSSADARVGRPQLRASPERTFSRRRALKALTMGSVTVLVAGTGALSLRAFLIAAACWPKPQRWALLGLIVIGTVPFAVLAWTALVPVLLMLVAAAVAVQLVRDTGPVGRLE